jgi:hypothetical protein
MSVTRPQVLVAVTSHTAPPVLARVLEHLRQQAPAAALAVVFTGPGGTDAHASAATTSTAAGAVLLAPGPLRIGQARTWLIDHVAAHRPEVTHVAFLDDDCPPRPGWWNVACRLAASDAALCFGPRYPAPPVGAGARIRAWEASLSAKLRAAAEPTAVCDPRMMVAGGNMLIALPAARKFGITDASFARGAFEDVDFQLRLAGAGELVLFHPALAVDHHDQVALLSLLRKSLLSGAGLARCLARHGERLWHYSRWQPVRVLADTSTMVWRYRTCPLPPWLRVLALVRAFVVVTGFLACRSHQFLARPSLRGRDDAPRLDGGGGSRSQLGGSPLAPPQQRGRIRG